MQTVFIAGSMTIKKLHPLFLERISNIVLSNLNVVVGDADGADTSIQEALLARNATSVTVYCSGPDPRNNVGGWPVKSIITNLQHGTRAFFTAKDIEMAKAADYGLMLWDMKSTGTLNNVFELSQQDKKCLVFINKEKSFFGVANPNDIEQLVNMMSEPSRAKAEVKINISNKLKFAKNKQHILSI